MGNSDRSNRRSRHRSGSFATVVAAGLVRLLVVRDAILDDLVEFCDCLIVRLLSLRQIPAALKHSERQREVVKARQPQVV